MREAALDTRALTLWKEGTAIHTPFSTLLSTLACFSAVPKAPLDSFSFFQYVTKNLLQGATSRPQSFKVSVFYLFCI